MPRVINPMYQKNLWGSTTSDGLEPQRTDLWYVDLSDVVKGLNSQKIFDTLKLGTVPTFFPQFVQAITLPELRTKAEMVRRDSVPYQMPSWDDPLDALKITFLYDTNTEKNGSKVIAVLQAWQALVRAGRGTRQDLYGTEEAMGDRVPVILLNDRFQIDCTFPVRVLLLRGSVTEKASLTPEQTAQLNQVMINQAIYQAEVDDTIYAVANNAFSTGTVQAGLLRLAAAKIAQLFNTRPLSQVAALEISGDWRFKDVWLGGWKFGDLSYAESKLLLVEATLYAESFDKVV